MNTERLAELDVAMTEIAQKVGFFTDENGEVHPVTGEPWPFGDHGPEGGREDGGGSGQGSGVDQGGNDGSQVTPGPTQVVHDGSGPEAAPADESGGHGLPGSTAQNLGSGGGGGGGGGGGSGSPSKPKKPGKAAQVVPGTWVVNVPLA